MSQNGAPVPIIDEMERLAKQQAERLHRKEEQRAAEPPKSESPVPAPGEAPIKKKIGEIYICQFEDGSIQVQGPINDPQKFLTLQLAATEVLFNHTMQKVAREVEIQVLARPKVGSPRWWAAKVKNGLAAKPATQKS